MLLDILSRTLRDAGFEVLMAADGLEAVARAKETTPDLVLLDLLLPKLDGFGVLKEFAADPKIAAVPVLVLSNLSGPEVVQKTQGYKISGLLIKASTIPEEIIAKIKEILKL